MLPRTLSLKSLFPALLLGVLLPLSSAAQITTFPHLQTFNAFPDGTGLAEGWSNPAGTGDQADWTAKCCGTPSTDTGPAVDTGGPGSTGKFVYYETSGPGPGDQAWLISPNIDLSSAPPGLGFRFAYHMFGATTGTLNVDVWNGTSYDTVITLVGQQQASETAPWLTSAVVNLGPYYGGTPHVRFRIDRGSTFTGDAAIDDFEVFNASAPSVAVTAITAPVSACTLTATELVTVSLRNLSTAAALNVPVSFQVSGPAAQGPVNAVVPILPPGVTTQYTFKTTANLAAAGTYAVTATAAIPGDVLPADNARTTTVVNGGFGSFAAPLREDWEAGAAGWTVNVATTSSWALGTPAKPTINGAPPSGGVNSWVTNLAGSYADLEQGAVVSPPLALCGITNPEVSLDVWWNSEFSWDGANLQVSYDEGGTWENVGAFGDANNWYTDNTVVGGPGGSQEAWSGRASTNNGSGGWLRARSVDLLPGIIRLRVSFGSDGSVTDDGVAFDNLLIRAAGLQTTLAQGAFQPAQPVASTDLSLGAVLMQASITPDVGDDLLRGLRLTASGPGNDATGVTAVRLVLEDAATRNGVVDGLDAVVYSGTWPADDGVLDVVFATPLQLRQATANSVLVVYDFGATASGATPPGSYTVTLDTIQVAGDVVVAGGTPPSGTALISRAADLAITLVDSPDPATAGGILTYLATLTNNGDGSAQNLGISLPIPAGTTLASAVASAGGSCTGTTTVVCSWPGVTTAGAGSARSATISVNLSPGQTAALSATATGTSATPDPTKPNTATATTAVMAAADLAITLADSPDPVNIKNTLTYVATLSNSGPSNAQDSSISLPLPAGTSFGNAMGSAGATCGGGSAVVCTWSGGTAPGATRMATVTVVVDPATTGTLSATATATSATTDPDPSDNSASTTTTVNPAGALTITPASLDFGILPIGSTAAPQTVTLGNTGGSPLTITTLTPVAAPFAATGGTCGAVPITIANGASCTLQFTFSPTASGPASQTLSLAAGGGGSGSISLAGTGGQGVLGVLGANLNFGPQTVGLSALRSLTISNTGDGPLQVSAISAVTPPFAEVPGGSCAALPFTLAAGASCTVQYRFQPAAAGIFSQTVTVTADVGTTTAILAGVGVVAVALPLGGYASLLLLILGGVGSMLAIGKRY